jgi:hypothetical protein
MKKCDFYEPQTYVGRISFTVRESNTNHTFNYASVAERCKPFEKSYIMDNYSGAEIMVQK